MVRMLLLCMAWAALAPAVCAADDVPAAPAAAVSKTGKKFAQVDDLKDKRIAVLQGSAHVDYAAKTWPKARLLQFSSPTDLVLAIKTGKADAGLSDAEALREMMREDRTLGVLGSNLFTFPEGVGFRKSNTALRDEFNRFLGKLKQDGIHADMVRRWVDDNVTTMPMIAERGSGVLVVGISDGALPFVAVKDNRLIGFDVELSRRFAAHLGKKVRFSQMEFSSLIAAVASGKVDMIISSLFITEERKKSINFSDPYYEEGVRAFSLKANIAAYDPSVTIPSATPQVPPLPWWGRVAQSFHNNIILEQRYLLLWDGLKTTLIIAIFSALLGTALGALICAMRMSPMLLLHLPARALIGLLRGMPVLVLLMLIFYVVFAGVDVSAVTVAVIAFALNFGGYTAEIFRSGVEGVDHGQSEAGIAMGFSRFATFIHIVLPQTMRRVMPVYRGEFISLVKMTSIVGYIAVQDLTKASDIIRSRTFDAFFPLILVAVMYFVIAWVLMLALEYIEHRMYPESARRASA